MPIVYLDILIALNWIIDTLLLYATAHVLRLTPRRIRVIVSGFSGAVSSCLIFLSDLPIAVLLVLHVLCACILVKIAYRFTGVKEFFKQTAVLYILSALFSGVITALWTLTDSEVLYTGNGIVYADISPLLLTGFAVVSYGVIRAYEYVTRKRAPQNHEFLLEVDDGHGVCRCRALYDTGLHLLEPFSGRPVVIVQRYSLLPILTAELSDALYCTVPHIANPRVRMVPYQAIGAGGLLPAFAPQRMTIKGLTGKTKDISGTYVAVTDALGRGVYEALIGSDCVRGC